jgi:hydrogenase expression/formation protein HypD
VKFVDEFRDPEVAKQTVEAIHAAQTQPWTIMEVCGGQTHAIVRFGLDELLPEGLTLVHGPGCPVCVTPVEVLDQAFELAARPDVILTSYGDMLRVPGSRGDLRGVKAAGGDVRVLYSPLEALQVAAENPDKTVVFLAVGFETTAPAHAMAVRQAAQRGLENFALLVSHVLVPPAMEAILSAPDNRVQGFLAAGHVCAVMGYREYEPLAEQYQVPIVVTGFEPLDLLQGVLMCVRQLEEGRHEVENQYVRVVREGGNQPARDLIEDVFEVVPRGWRGLGEIPRSGLGLRERYARFDAARRFELSEGTAASGAPTVCVAGDVLRGTKQPHECPAFGGECTPESPLGAPMVSAEGACAAYYRYRRGSAS